jgi:hypothetical protein
MRPEGQGWRRVRLAVIAQRTDDEFEPEARRWRWRKEGSAWRLVSPRGRVLELSLGRYRAGVWVRRAVEKTESGKQESRNEQNEL